MGQPQTAINIEYNSRRKRSLLQELSFDAWGDRRNSATWRSFTGTPPEPLFDRGFTGHEHLYAFGLINMNGRMYDPLVSRMLSPDNFIQAPDFSQSFNKYSYCLNNPLKYSDPSGEFFIIDSWLIGLFSGGFKEANKRAWNDIKIWGGLFASDPNKGLLGRFWETISRFTWQLPQTIGGWGTAQACNTLGLKGGVESVKYKYGATVVATQNSWDGAAITQVSYIVGGSELQADPNNSLFQHEYGHYIQSQSIGWAYYQRVGLPSAGSEHGKYKLNYPSHDYHPVEQDANRRAFLYFNKHVTGFQNDTYLSDNLVWNFVKNPLDVYKTGHGIYIDYNNSYDLQLLNNLKVRATLGDYISWLCGGPIGAALYGWYNSYNYNN